jgi:tRNA pseudouridine55 synthase
VDGFLFVNKPPGPTSFDIVRQVRKGLGGAKVGHAGTLDPLASGLLICGIGGATRLLPYLPAEPKKYSFGIRFGTETDTLDTEGTVVRDGGRVPSREEVEAALPRFTGDLSQTPPKYSAKKVQGERAYDLARKNCEFELNQAQVTVYSLSLAAYDEKKAEAALDAACSGGTYVRALCRDIAMALGTFGHASFIRRVAIGPFMVAAAIVLEEIDDIKKHIVPIHQALASLPSVKVTAEQCEAIAKGKDVRTIGTGKTVIAYTEKDEIAAVLSRTDENVYHPVKVFLSVTI